MTTATTAKTASYYRVVGDAGITLGDFEEMSDAQDYADLHGAKQIKVVFTDGTFIIL